MVMMDILLQEKERGGNCYHIALRLTMLYLSLVISGLDFCELRSELKISMVYLYRTRWDGILVTQTKNSSANLKIQGSNAGLDGHLAT